MTPISEEECDRKHSILWKLSTIFIVLLGLMATLTAWSLHASYQVQADYSKAQVDVAVTKADLAHIKASLIEVKFDLTDIRKELRQLREEIK